MPRRTITALALAVAVLALAASFAAGASAGAATGEYDGQPVDLSDPTWEGARACAVVGDGTHCFASEVEMDAWLASSGGVASPSARSAPSARTAGVAAAAALSCASSLRLYENGGFGGRVLYLSTRGRWQNLSSFSFGNITSSFIVGACTSYLADGASGGGSWYPGGGAYTSAGVLAGGWNDRISSVYLV